MSINIYINDDKISIDKPTVKKKYNPIIKSREELFRHVDFRYKDIFKYNPLRWSIRTANILDTNGIKSYYDLASCTESQIRKWKNAGRKTLTEVQCILEILGLQLREDI